MAVALGFYRDLLVLEVQRQFAEGPSGQICFLGAAGQPNIELIAPMPEGAAQPAGFSLGITVESLSEAVAQVEAAGYPVFAGPIQPNPHVRFCFVHDPDGHEVQLLENC
jgi:lactoylglutathione lyase